MAKKPKSRVKRSDVEKIMLQVLKDCGVDPATAKLIHKKLVYQFMEKFVAAILDRDGIELRGLMVGIRHWQSKTKLIIKLSTPKLKHKGGKDGFDFESCVDG